MWRAPHDVEIVRRYDPDFAAFHRRPTDAAKPEKVIRVALAHKLLTCLNAKGREFLCGLNDLVSDGGYDG